MGYVLCLDILCQVLFMIKFPAIFYVCVKVFHRDIGVVNRVNVFGVECV